MMSQNHIGVALNKMVQQLEPLVAHHSWSLITSEGWIERGGGTLLHGMANKPRDIASYNSPQADLQAVRHLCLQIKSGRQPDVLVALGGGSVIDLTKTMAASLAHGSIDKVETILRKDGMLPFLFNTPPIIAIPTITGSAAELTATATIWDVDGKKAALQGQSLRPKHVIYVPEFLSTVPFNVALSSMMDAFSHAHEAIWNRKASAMSDGYASDAIRGLLHLGKDALSADADVDDLTRLINASRSAGLAIDITKTSLAHSMSYPVSAKSGLAHGLAASLALVSIAELCVYALPKRAATLALAHNCSAHELPSSIAQFLRNTGAAKQILNAAEQLKPAEFADELIVSPRQRNFPVNVSAPMAVQLFDRALKLLRG